LRIFNRISRARHLRCSRPGFSIVAFHGAEVFFKGEWFVKAIFFGFSPIDFPERAFYNEFMEETAGDSFAKLAEIASDMRLEVDDNAGPAADASAPCPAGLPIHMAALPGGKRVPLLKSLLTSACERNCYYCPFQAGRDTRRTTFKPDEMADLVVRLTDAKVIQGAFLSSGVAGGSVRTQDRLIAAAEILRYRRGYRGYLHLKLMPGAETAQIERAMQLADRVSVNLEAPNPHRLGLLAPQKVMLDELLQPLRVVEHIRRTQPAARGWKGRWPSSTTQFVVGAVGESDLELLQTVAYLYRKLRLARSYFSGFNPIRGTPFEDRAPIRPWRSHRLYQASYLLRDYGFELEDLPFEGEGALPLDIDPKQAWARQSLSQAPVEINHAEREELLKIPGIGPVGAQAILSARVNGGRLRSLEDLKALGVLAARAAPFILIDGRRPPVQMALFDRV
jgi:predicted DNA-binding helix-hairpin-helix protein